MIARFRVLLPFVVHLPKGEALAAHEFSIADCTCRVNPPFQSALTASDKDPDSSLPLQTMIDRLEPAEPQTCPVKLDDAESVSADVFAVDFFKADFVRTPGSDDPPTEAAFAILNAFLVRLRLLGRAGSIRPLDHKTSCWRIDFLSDEGARLPRTPPLVRRRVTAALAFRANGLKRELWDAIWMLPPDYQPSTSDVLLIDAHEALPQDVGSAVVLAAAAMEERIATALEILADGKVDPVLWEWMNDRGGHTQGPSTVERADVLLRSFGGRSLREEPQLFHAFKSLLDARDTFVRGGPARLSTGPLTSAKAAELVNAAGRIIDWIETLLPSSARRRTSYSPTTFEYKKPFTIPPPPA
jgi:hypothetical protein